MKPRKPQVIPYFAGITYTFPGGQGRAILALIEMGEKLSNNGTLQKPMSKEQSSSTADEACLDRLDVPIDDGGLS
jgi:hypothetical protein